MRRLQFVYCAAIVGVLVGAPALLPRAVKTADARVLSVVDMGKFVGAACCRHWEGGEDCQKCRRKGETQSVRYWEGGVAQRCVEGTPDGCTMTGIHDCDGCTIPNCEPTGGYYYYNTPDCSGDEISSSRAEKKIKDAVGEACTGS